MKFTEIPRTRFITDVLKEARSRPVGKQVTKEEIADLAKLHDQELIGKGRSSVVVPYPGEKDVVMTIFFEPVHPSIAQAQLALHQGFQQIWPRNFAEMYASFGETGDNLDGISGTVSKRILGNVTEVYPVIGNDEMAKRRKEAGIRHPFYNVSRICRDEKIPLAFKDNLHNFIINPKDGGEYYVDVLEPEEPIPVSKVTNYLLYIRRTGVARHVRDSFSQYNELLAEIEASGLRDRWRDV